MKKMKYILLSLSALALAFSCAKEENPIPESGGIKSIKLEPGYESVTLLGEVAEEAKVARIDMRWTEGEEEKEYSLEITGTTFEEEIAVAEGSYLFRFSTYDAKGGRIASFPMTGKALGPAPTGGAVDVTSTYLLNPGPHFDAVDGSVVGNKYGLLKDWDYTQNIVNHDGNTTGGWKLEGDQNLNVIHFETANWDNPGTGYENGKVWQSPTLPAGTYVFTANYFQGDGGDGVEMYVVAASGEQLPDIANLSGALASKAIDRSSSSRGDDREGVGDNTIMFTLTKDTQVSLGLVVTIIGSESGGNSHWQQFRNFKLGQIPTVDITSSYIKNAGPSLEAAHRVGGKWGTLKDWSYTDNILNQEDNTVGGWSTDSGGVIHLETDHWGGPGFDNGKIWQTFNLPAGTYCFIVRYGAAGDDFSRMNINIAVAAGSELPDIANLETGALAYRHLDAENGRGGKDHAVYFTLTENKQVSLGLVVTITGEGGIYIQFNSFKLQSLFL